jgi:hypothetical protein
VLCLGLLAVLGLGRGAVLDASPSDPVRVLTGRVLDVVTTDLRDAAVTGILVGAAVLVAAAVLGLVLRAFRRTVAS